MNLIEIRKRKLGTAEKNSVDARELHEFLESKQQFSHWIKGRINAYDFMQAVDFIAIDNFNYSPPRKEYHLTIEMAKELSMVERNENGKIARKYFIECEKVAKDVSTSQLPDFTNPAESARAWANEFELKQIAENKLIEQKPMVEFAKAIEGTGELISVGDYAKITGKFGRNTLFRMMREQNILQDSNIPYQRYIDQGYFEVKESITKRTKSDMLIKTTYITGKGQVWLSKKTIRR